MFGSKYYNQNHNKKKLLKLSVGQYFRLIHSKVAVFYRNCSLTPLRQEQANLPVKLFILIFRQLLKVEEKNVISLKSYFLLFYNVLLRKNIIFRLFIFLCMMRKIFPRSNHALKLD